MPYITTDYYLNEYEGINSNDPNELTRSIKRASDVIDMITGYRIARGEVDLDATIPFIKSQVQKATASLVETYISNGGYNAYQAQQAENVSLGSFSYSMRTTSGSNVSVPAKVIDMLNPTGLLYAGINTVGGGVYYDR